jgi:amino acid transporter
VGGTSPAGEGRSDGRYAQQLHRGIPFLGNLAITLSFLTPTASVFVTASLLITLYGSGSFLSLVIAAVAAFTIALCFAELGSLFPIAGGHYSVVVRVLGRGLGFVAFVLFAVEVVLIMSASALGVAQYLNVVWSGADKHVVGTVVIVIATLIAALGIRLNSAVTGVFLVLELAAIVTVTVAGFVDVHQPASILIDAKTVSNGKVVPVPFGSIVAGVTLGLFAFEGYQMAIVFSEETRGPRRAIGNAVVGALLVAVVAEIAPLTAGIMGAGSLGHAVASPAPLLDVVNDNISSSVKTVVSLGVAVAIFNAVIASALTVGRVVFSSARDRAWPEPVNIALGSVHPRLRTPWIATLLFGASCAVFTALSSLAALVTFTAVVVLVLYVMVAVAAIVSRVTQRSLERPWKMPLWPLPPLAGLAFIGFTFSKQKLSDVWIVAAIVGVAAIYWLVYLRPRSEHKWLALRAAAMEPDERAPAAATTASRAQ